MTIATVMRRIRGASVPAAIAAAMCLSTSGASLAQPYPVRPIRIIAPYTPGSPNDVMARLLTQHLPPRLGQPIVIDNKPGGGTTIGTKAAAHGRARRLYASVLSSAW